MTLTVGPYPVVTGITRQDVEAALDAGKLEALMNSAQWWRVRRNGKTQTWKRSPSRFRIPVKAGLKSYGEITEHTIGRGYFRIVHGADRDHKIELV